MTGKIKYAIDMITLYEPTFWGLNDWNEFKENEDPVNAVLTPDKFWDKALDTVAGTGVQGIRCTFGPSDFHTALARYGSPEKFAKALAERDLELAAGFYVGTGRGDMLDPDRQKVILREAREYADFLVGAGSDILVTGLGHRKTWNSDDAVIVGLDYAKRAADFANTLGYELSKKGVRLALHPKTHGVFWLKRDIDLFMMLTDPVYVSFCPDAAHLTLAGTDPVEVLKDHRDRVIIADWKDAKSAVPMHYVIDEHHLTNIHPYYRFVGSGTTDWARWVRTLRDMNYEGWAVIELDATSDPRAEILAAKHYVDTSLAPIYT